MAWLVTLIVILFTMLVLGALVIIAPLVIDTLIDAVDMWRELFERLRERWNLE